jgi:leucyl aminopeptidase (aminopeptidase T)
MSASRRKSKASPEKLYSEVARKILSDSLHIKKGESVTIETWSNSMPLARQMVIETRKIGAIPLLILEDEEAYVDGIKNMPEEMVGTMGKHEINLLAGSDAYIFIPGPPLGSYYTRLTGEQRAVGMRYNSSWYEAAEKAKLRGVRFTMGYVGKDVASLVGKKVDQVVTHQLKAILEPDFSSISNHARQIKPILQDGATCELSSPDGLILSFMLKGETEIEDAIVDEEDVKNGNNLSYVPAGFVSKEVDSSSVSGKASLTASVTRFGLIKDAILEFESGKLTGWKSKSSKDRLNKLVESAPEDTRKLTMLTIGLNPSMKYGYGQDRLVEGAIGLGLGFRYIGVVQRGSLTVGSTKIVDKGKLGVS